VGGGVYGCDLAEAQEIIPLRPMTRLPGAPPFVRGLINMRGTIVTVLDLGQRLDPARQPIESGAIVLVRDAKAEGSGERLVGLVVDEVADVRLVSVDESTGGGVVRGLAVDVSADGGGGDADDRGDAAAVVVLDLGALIQQVLLS
jgi:purine-binding chemotaxis protein CheW